MFMTLTVSVPVPAVFALSVAYDVLDNLNVELTWDRTFWSKYKDLDFDFSPANPYNPFEAPLTKNWDDTNCFRLGLTYGVTDTLTLMGGFAYDENPVPDRNILVLNCLIPMPGSILLVLSIK